MTFSSRAIAVQAVALLLGLDCLQAAAQFRRTTEAVEVPVMVVEKRQPVTGLGSSDFIVLEDDQPVRIIDVSIDSRPLDVTVLLDVSESTRLPWIDANSDLIAAAKGVRQLLRPGDTFSIHGFSERLERLDPDALSLIVPSGQTAMFDAILQVLLQKPMSSRRIVIVLTDGLDTASSVPVEITSTVAERSDSIVHVVALSRQSGHWYFGPLWSGTGVIRAFFAELEALSVRTGGRFFVVDKPAGFLPVLRELFEQERTRYYLRFTPATVSPGWHTLAVSTLNRKQQVIHRRGYFRPH